MKQGMTYNKHTFHKEQILKLKNIHNKVKFKRGFFIITLKNN